MVAVVVNHNGADLLPRCLEALAAGNWTRLEVVVVDNGSSDGSPARAKESFPGLTLLGNAKNLGFCRAANRGLAHARARGAAYCFLLNNDVFVKPRSIPELVRFMEASPMAGACQPLLVYDSQPRTVQSAGCGLALSGRAWDQRAGEPAAGLGEAPLDVLGVTGGAMFLRCAALEGTGPLWPHFTMYFEDVDLSLRLRQEGWSLYCLPRAVARHVARGTAGWLPQWRRIILCERNALLLAVRNFPLPWALAALLLGPLSALAGAAAQLTAGRLANALAYPAGALAGLALGLALLPERLFTPWRGTGAMDRVAAWLLFPPIVQGPKEQDAGARD